MISLLPVQVRISSLETEEKSLSPTTNKDIEEKITHCMRNIAPELIKTDNIETISIKYIGHGHNNSHHLVKYKLKDRIRCCVIRRNLSPENERWNKTLREYSLLKFLGEQGFPYSPEVFYADISKKLLDEPFIIMEHINGHKINTIDEIGLKKIASFLSYLHSITPSDKLIHILGISSPWETVNCFYDKLNVYYDTIKKINHLFDKSGSYSNILNLIKKNINESKSIFNLGISSRLSHGDVGIQNILTNDENFYFIDWEHCGYLDTGYDLAWFFCREALDDSSIKEFLTCYSLSEDDIHFRKRIAVYSEMFHLESSLWAISCYLDFKGQKAKSIIPIDNLTFYNSVLQRANNYFARQGINVDEPLITNLRDDINKQRLFS